MLSSVTFLFGQIGEGAQNAIESDSPEYATGAGNFNEASGQYSFAAGSYVKATALNSMVFGSADNSTFGKTNYLLNNIPNSMMIGFNVGSKPSLFVQGFDNGTLGYVGIHTTDPRSTLDVAGALTVDRFFMPGKFAVDGDVLTYNALTGEATWVTPTVGGVNINGVTGSGNDEYIPRWNGTGSVLENSIIIAKDNGVGIGTTNIGSNKLKVAGIIAANIGTSNDWNEAYSWGNHALAGYIKMGLNIPNGANLDAYALTGFYHQNSDSYAGNGSNYPVAKAGMLTVLSKDGKVYQSYQSNGVGNAVYTRTKYGSYWSTWQRAWTSGDFTQDDIDKWNSGSGGGIGTPGLWEVVSGTKDIYYGEPTVGYVGIGTVPEESLHTKGKFLTEGGIKLRGEVNTIEFEGSATSKFQIKNGELSTLNSAFTIDANDNIGIGQDTPGAKLHVGGDIKAEESILAEGDVLAVGNVSADQHVFSKGFFLNDNTNSVFYYGKNGQASTFSLVRKVGENNSSTDNIDEPEETTNPNKVILKVDDDNNVGIGTNAPNAKLDVAGDVKISETLDVEGNVQLESDLDVEGEINSIGNILTQGSFNLQNSNSAIYYGTQAATNQFNIINVATPHGSSYKVLTIDEMSRVGIHTSTPDAELDVNGTTKTSGFQMTSGSDLGGKILQSDASGNASWVDPGTLSGVGIWDETNSVANYNGSVGIGTANVGTHKLVVAGSINATLIKVTETVPSSDYVFEPDYSLMPLNELETFVKTNKHLPEVMSAEEFARDGYSLGEMDDVLLRKVEELTLYVIDQDKTINGQQDILEQQQVLLEKQQKLIDQLLEAQK